MKDNGMSKRNSSVQGMLARAALLVIVGWYFIWRVFFSLPYKGSILEMVLGSLLVF